MYIVLVLSQNMSPHNRSYFRSSVAAIVSEIACVDFPDNWTGLFDQLLNMMGTGEPNQVHGVMKVLAELSADITDSQVG